MDPRSCRPRCSRTARPLVHEGRALHSARRVANFRCRSRGHQRAGPDHRAGLYVAPFTTCTVRFCAVPGDGSTRFPRGLHAGVADVGGAGFRESVTKAWLDVNGDGRQDFMKLRHVDANGAETEPTCPRTGPAVRSPASAWSMSM